MGKSVTTMTATTKPQELETAALRLKTQDTNILDEWHRGLVRTGSTGSAEPTKF